MNKKYLSEFIGTFFLVFIGTGSIMINSISNSSIGHLGISLTFGFTIFVLIYIFGPISGAHFNPAVTIALGLKGGIPRGDLLPYIGSQLLGSILGSTILRIMFGNIKDMGTTLPSKNIGNFSIMISFTFEFIFTLLLMYVIMCVISSQTKDDFKGALVIGLTIFIGALIAGPISGGSFNPARSIGPAILSGNFHELWIYILAPILGTITGKIIFEYNTISKEKEILEKTKVSTSITHS